MLEERIPITISGQIYEIIGNPSDALYYNSLAQYVESKMKEIEKHTNIISSQKVAVLAALNITDELFRERDRKSDSGRSLDKRHEELIHLLDQALNETQDNKSQSLSVSDSLKVQGEELILESA